MPGPSVASQPWPSMLRAARSPGRAGAGLAPDTLYERVRTDVWLDRRRPESRATGTEPTVTAGSHGPALNWANEPTTPTPGAEAA